MASAASQAELLPVRARGVGKTAWVQERLAAGVTATPERAKLDFAEPGKVNVQEIVVTGPGPNVWFNNVGRITGDGVGRETVQYVSVHRLRLST
jgi:hypothetical protein